MLDGGKQSAGQSLEGQGIGADYLDQLGTQGAVRSAVTDSLAGAATDGAAAVQAATKPLLSRLAGVTAEAGQAQVALREVVLWASWRLLGWVMAGVAGLVLWWDTGTIAAAQIEKAQLQQQVAELQAVYDAWVKAGMLGKLERCNPGLRPCIRVNEGAGPFESEGHNDYRVIQGY